jgi:hypothetical protein
MDPLRKKSVDTRDGCEMSEIRTSDPMSDMGMEGADNPIDAFEALDAFASSYISSSNASEDGLGPSGSGLRHRTVSGVSSVFSSEKRGRADSVSVARSVVRPRTTVSIGEYSLLSEMEGKDAYIYHPRTGMDPSGNQSGKDGSGMGGGRFRSGSQMPNRTPFQNSSGQVRKNSLLADGSDGEPQLFTPYSDYKTTPFKAGINRIVKTVQYLTPTFYYRLNIYILLFFFVIMLTISDTLSQSIDQYQIFVLYSAAVALDFSMSIVDRIVFKLIDVVFSSYYDIAYLLHSINGPLGMLLTAIIMAKYFSYFNASDIFPGRCSHVPMSPCSHVSMSPC